MKRTSLIATVALGSTLAMGAVGASAVLPAVAGAQTSQTQSADPTGTSILAKHPRLRALLRHEGKVAANTIGIPGSELRQALKDGQSVADVAQAHGVEPQTVIDAIVKDLDARIDKAVQDNKISSERGATVKDKAPERVTRAVNWHRGQNRAAATN